MAAQKSPVCKKGNWFEEKILEEKTGIRFYPDPKDKQSSLITKDRCIIHSDQMNPKDYKSTTTLTITVPQKHPDYLTAKKSSIGPRQAMMAANMKAAVESEFNSKAASEHAANRIVVYSSVNADTYNRPSFKPSLVEKDPGNRIPTFNTDYSTEPAITYYTDKIANGKSINFPVTYTNSLRNPFMKSNAFSSDIRDSLARRCESNENPKPYPKLREYRELQALRQRIIRGISIPDKSPGAAIRCMIGYLFSVANEIQSDYIEVEDLAAGLADNFGFVLSEDDKQALLIAYSNEDSSRISLPGFASLLRASLTPRQVEIVNILYEQLATASAAFGKVTEAVITARFRPSRQAGELSSFLMGLGFPTDNDGVAILDDFLDYYSAALADLGDDTVAFESLIRSTWGI